MKNFVVYTAITHGYDCLQSPLELWRAEADFIAFLDSPQSAAGWETRPVYRRFRDPCRNAKIHKILPHKYFPEAEYSLWIDGSIRLKSPLCLAQWVEQYLGNHDLAVFPHRSRTCVYEEAAVCLAQGLDSTPVINRQMKKYRAEGYPPNNGLAECTVLLRRHTDRVRRFNEAWYEEIKTYSRRDQLSFNYAAQKVGLRCHYLPGRISRNPHFDWLKHTQPRSTIDAFAD